MTIQPHQSERTAAAPEIATARRNQTVFGMSRRRHQTNSTQAPRAMKAVQIPIIASKERCRRVLAGGRFWGGIEF